MSTYGGSSQSADRYNPQNQQQPLHPLRPSRYKQPSPSAAPVHHNPNYSPYVHSAEQLGIPINYQNHPYRYIGHAGAAGTFGASEKDSAVYLSVDPTSLQELDLRLMNIDPNMSPASGITSPMDLGFSNIGDEQSSDNLDLNSITPSIKLASSLNLLAPSDFPPTSSSGHNDRRSATSSTTTTPLIKGGDYGCGGSGDLIPSTSCPVETSGSIYLSGTATYESPTTASAAAAAAAVATGLSIPHRGGGGGGGTASGGSADSSVTGAHPWGGGGSGSLTSTPVTGVSGGGGEPDNQRVALIKARSKKDSHNRIERKRRDYINCQITELGNLLPEEMFRENDCKKNKGSILKNSVEYICALQRENQCYAGLYSEANLASTVINRLIKRIQDLESSLPPDFLAKMSSGGGGGGLVGSGGGVHTIEYRSMFQEWSKLHDANQQSIASSGSAMPSASATPCHGHVSVDTSESSPGISSGNNDDLGNYLDPRGDSNSPVPPVVGGRSTRTRCASLTANPPAAPQALALTPAGENSHHLGGGGVPAFVGSLPSRGGCGLASPPCRILPQTASSLSASPAAAVGMPPQQQRIHQLRPMFSTGGAGGSSSKLIGKRSAGLGGKPHPTKMEEGGIGIGIKQSPMFCGSGGGGDFGGLSTSLPVRMAPGDFPTISEMDSDDTFMHLSSEGAGDGGMAFKPEPMVEVSQPQPSGTGPFQPHSHQQLLQFGSSGGAGTHGRPPQPWFHHRQHQQQHQQQQHQHHQQQQQQQQLSRPMSAGQHPPPPPPQLNMDACSPSPGRGMTDELVFEPGM